MSEAISQTSEVLAQETPSNFSKILSKALSQVLSITAGLVIASVLINSFGSEHPTPKQQVKNIIVKIAQQHYKNTPAFLLTPPSKDTTQFDSAKIENAAPNEPPSLAKKIVYESYGVTDKISYEKNAEFLKKARAIRDDNLKDKNFSGAVIIENVYSSPFLALDEDNIKNMAIPLKPLCRITVSHEQARKISTKTNMDLDLVQKLVVQHELSHCLPISNDFSAEWLEDTVSLFTTQRKYSKKDISDTFLHIDDTFNFGMYRTHYGERFADSQAWITAIQKGWVSKDNWKEQMELWIRWREHARDQEHSTSAVLYLLTQMDYDEIKSLSTEESIKLSHTHSIYDIMLSSIAPTQSTPKPIKDWFISMGVEILPTMSEPSSKTFSQLSPRKTNLH